MRHIETANVRIAARRTSELVPLCDLYVASVSSTIRWAIACGKPVINYDVYRYRYTDFLNLDGVLVIEEQSEFREIVRRLDNEPDELAQLRERQEAVAPRWGFLDGRCSDRILQLLEQYRRQRPSGLLGSKDLAGTAGNLRRRISRIDHQLCGVRPATGNRRPSDQ